VLVLLVTLLPLLWSGFFAVIDPNIAQLNDYMLLNLLLNYKSILAKRAEYKECSQMLRVLWHSEN